MDTIATNGIDLIPKIFQLADGSVVKFQIYDTCGQERYNSINEFYYRRADAILLVYDISNRNSFLKIRDYYCDKIKELCNKDIPIILLGNKTDLEDERKVPQEEGIALALSHNYKFKETSCMKNENVADSFEALIELWNVEYQKTKSVSKKDKNISLNGGKIKKKKCCM